MFGRCTGIRDIRKSGNQEKIGTLTIIDRDANFNDLIDDPGATGVVTYSYDPASPERLRRAGGFNRRIRKVLAVPNPDITYDYYYNESWQVLEVRKGGDTDPLEQYVWGIQYVDAPVVRFRDGNVDGDLLDTQDNTDSTLYYTYDGNFNVTAVIKPDGTVAERYTYDPYGKVTFKAADWSDAASQAKSAYDNEILYCGYRFDPESGLYQVRNRYLTPPLGRWLTTDPIGYGDGMNRYQYVGDAPVGSLDQWGLESWTYEQYFDLWKQDHPGLTPQQYKWAKDQLTRGCIGVTIINLGRDPTGLNCWETQKQAETEAKKMEKKCKCGKDSAGNAIEPKVYSIHLWNDTGNDPTKPDVNPGKKKGQVDLKNWNKYGRPPGKWNDGKSWGCNFDFGWLEAEDQILDANHSYDPRTEKDDPMKVLKVTLKEWGQQHDGSSYYNTEVWCVDCPGNWGKKAS